MADNLIALLLDAHKVATGGQAKIFGVEIGIVTNVQDPGKQGRVKLCFPWLPGNPESGWARVVQPAAGAGRGFYWIPEVNDEVLVAFERGEANRPFVVGALWNGKDKPMEGAYTDENTTRMIQTKSGHQLILDDAKDAERIVIADKSGKRTLTFDVANKKLLVEAAEGDIVLRAEKKIVIDCEDLEVKTSKTGKMEVGSTFDLKVAEKAQISAGPRMNLQGQRVNLNSSSSAAAVAALALAAARALAAAVASAAAGDSGAAGTGGSGAGNAAAGSAGAGPAGGNLSSDVVTPAPAAPGAGDAPGAQATEAATAADELDVQLVNPAGTPQESVSVELTLPDGDLRTASTDSQGHLRLEGLTVSGNARLNLPGLKAIQADASTASRVRYVSGGVDVPIGSATVVELPAVVRRARLTGMHFDTGKTFLLPSAMDGMRRLVELYGSFKEISGLVNGHTDRQGKGGVDAAKDPGAAALNLGLSNERAEAVKAFLLQKPGDWTRFYSGTRFSAAWGVREDQLMLGTVTPKGSETPFLSPLQADGVAGPATVAACKAFQQSRLLSVTGHPDAQTRRELVDAYMKLEGTSLDGKATLLTHGCGMTHPLPETEGDRQLTPEQRAEAQPDQPVNRRVEVFLFDGEVAPLPQASCPAGGCKEYAAWSETLALDVQLDENAAPEVTIEEFTARAADADGANAQPDGQTESPQQANDAAPPPPAPDSL
jgi:outer membrane protein OmpA-like peptidoglycan-associated protein/phage baseplate assembly protein gpV